MNIEHRASGLLMHVSSLPGKFGIGDLGNSAYDFVNFLYETETKYWQILPLHPTGFGNSPYQGLSAFAGNPLFIDPSQFVELGLLRNEELNIKILSPEDRVNFPIVEKLKRELFLRAYDNFSKNGNISLKKEFENFKFIKKEWLEDFCLFMAIRENYHLSSFKDWPNPLKFREPQALLFFEEQHSEEIEFHAFLQFAFNLQWQNFKEYVHTKGINLIGDIPIFVGYDCAEVWASPELFKLNDRLEPEFVAGVPPDYFSPTGQLWGNPLYNWENHQNDHFQWWVNRIKETLKYVDLIRLDHFRGFAGYYQIPFNAKTAESGKWVKGPDSDFFDAIQKNLGSLPFIAEDLGVITKDVIDLREKFDLPGMKILQFAFGGNSENGYLPHNYAEDCVAYTGTHDNPSIKGWYEYSASDEEKLFCRKYLGNPREPISHAMIRSVWSSVAFLTIAQMQDILLLGKNSRMNTPATIKGNWSWRLKPEALTVEIKTWLKEINNLYSRGLNI
jgi:4-alpha-glucanotransferase